MLREKRQQTIQATEKALDLLQIVANGERELSINALAQRLKTDREEVLLLLVAMENKGLVTWDSRRKIYNPGGATLEMVRNIEQRFSRVHPLPRAAAPLS
ncbi:MAG TPA: helix-turn-helix domain-containing protein [Geobacteraceae bacterium]